MRIFLEYIRTILVSPEFLIVLISGSIVLCAPTFVGSIREALNLSPEIVKWFALAPVTLLGLIFRESRKVLFPAKDRREALQKWNAYWQLRVTVNVALMYAVIFVLMALPAWIVSGAWFSDAALALMGGAIIGAGVDYISVYNAELKINELFARYSEEDSMP